MSSPCKLRETKMQNVTVYKASQRLRPWKPVDFPILPSDPIEGELISVCKVHHQTNFVEVIYFALHAHRSIKSAQPLPSILLSSLYLQHPIHYLYPTEWLMTDIPSGSWLPFCSSPATIGSITRQFSLRINAVFSMASNFNLEMSSNRNACISATLSRP